MTITRTFNLCLNKGNGVVPHINISQYDEEVWKFKLYTENGQRFIPATGSIIGVKADGLLIDKQGTVDGTGQVVIDVNQQMTAAAGKAEFELLIENQTHGTANFIVDVEQRAGENAIPSESDLSLLQEAVNSSQEILDIIGDTDLEEIVKDDIDAWLDAHPEATTTVQDGAITAPKINNSLWDKLLVSEEASGAVASFDDGADDVPVSSLKVNLEPIQTGSGDPSPSNIRPIYPANGKNLADFRNGYSVNASGQVVAYGTRIATVDPIAIKSGVSYKVVYSGNAANAIYAVFNGSTLVRRNVGIASGTVLDTSGGTDLYVCVYASESVTVTVDSSHAMVIDSSITDPSYQPYQGIMVEQTGKNLLDASTFINKPWNADTVNNARARPAKAIVVPVGSVITVSVSTEFLSKYFYAVLQMNSDFPASSTVGDSAWKTTSTTTVTMATNYLGINVCRRDSGTVDLDDLKTMQVQVEYGNTATAYVPFVEGASYPYTLGQSVYGGTVDLATGVLTVDRVCKTLETARNLSGTYQGSIIYNQGSPETSDADFTKPIICNRLKFVGNWTTGFEFGTCINYINVSFNLWLKDSAFSSLSEATTWLNENETQLCYYLATPTTVQLTPTQVKTLLGYNNISSSGTVEVIYHADTKLYVDKMTNVDNAIIAPTEETFTATRNYTVNDLVIVADTLYKVTANIASGSAITPNSNVQQTTLSALIKALS